jgi:hypothetical protein
VPFIAEELELLLELGAMDEDEGSDDEPTELLAMLDTGTMIELDALLMDDGIELLATLELLAVLQPMRSVPIATSSNQPSTPLLCW